LAKWQRLRLCKVAYLKVAAAADTGDDDDDDVLLVCVADQRQYHAAQDVPRDTSVSVESQPWRGVVP